MEKSHVGMGYSICPVCCKKHNEVVLLDKRLQKSLNRDNFMGWELCPEHAELEEEYIALVEVRNGKERGMKLETADRTGNFAHVRRSAWEGVFKQPVPKVPLVFIEVGVLEKLQLLREELPA